MFWNSPTLLRDIFCSSSNSNSNSYSNSSRPRLQRTKWLPPFDALFRICLASLSRFGLPTKSLLPLCSVLLCFCSVSAQLILNFKMERKERNMMLCLKNNNFYDENALENVWISENPKWMTTCVHVCVWLYALFIESGATVSDPVFTYKQKLSAWNLPI